MFYNFDIRLFHPMCALLLIEVADVLKRANVMTWSSCSANQTCKI